MKAVIDTSIFTHLRLADELSILTEVYEKVKAPPAVYSEISSTFDKQIQMLMHDVIKPIDFARQREEEFYGNIRRFYKLVNRWKNKTGLNDQGDIEVLISFLFYTDREGGEMLFANKEARVKFSKYIKPFGESKIRDIADLPKLADCGGLDKWGIERCIQYLSNLQNARYNTSEIRRNIKYYKKLLGGR